MGVRQLLRTAGIAAEERRRSPRISCRLRCTILTRRRVPARVLDVSEGGLCILSPIPFKARRTLVIELEVPSRGQVGVEAVVWHVRPVKSGASGRHAWSIGMMISKAGPGFGALLPEGGGEDCGSAREALASALSEMAGEQPAPVEESLALEEDALSAAELDALAMADLTIEDEADLAPLSTEERESVSGARGGSSPDDTLKLFRVRVKARTGPRTRTLTLGALSVTEAAALAASSLGEDWAILETKPA